MAPSVQRRKVWLTPTAGVPCIDAAKMRNPLKLAGVPQTTGPISAASGPKFTILRGHVEEILLLRIFFTIDRIKLSEHAMKVVERISEHRIRQQIEADDMQFGFMKGKETTDAIFTVRQMQENFRVKGKKLYFGFVDL